MKWQLDEGNPGVSPFSRVRVLRVDKEPSDINDYSCVGWTSVRVIDGVIRYISGPVTRDDAVLDAVPELVF